MKRPHVRSCSYKLSNASQDPCSDIWLRREAPPGRQLVRFGTACLEVTIKPMCGQLRRICLPSSRHPFHRACNVGEQNVYFPTTLFQVQNRLSRMTSLDNFEALIADGVDMTMRMCASSSDTKIKIWASSSWRARLARARLSGWCSRC